MLLNLDSTAVGCPQGVTHRLQCCVVAGKQLWRSLCSKRCDNFDNVVAGVDTQVSSTKMELTTCWNLNDHIHQPVRQADEHVHGDRDHDPQMPLVATICSKQSNEYTSRTLASVP